MRILVLVISLLAALPAAAQDYEQHWRRCVGREGVEPDERIRSCTVVIDSGRENRIGTATAFHNRGVGYEQKRQWPQAIEQFSEAIRRNPPHMLALLGRGNAYVQSGEPARAIQDYDAALAVQPNNAFALMRRGVAHAARQDHVRAIADYDAALRIEPGMILALMNRAATNGLRGEYEASLRDHVEVVRLAPSNLDALAGVCINAVVLDRLEQAMPACEATLRRQPRHPRALFSRGLVHLKGGHLDAAIADFTEALAVEQHAHMLYARAVARARKGDDAGAQADFASARFVMPDIDLEMARYGVR